LLYLCNLEILTMKPSVCFFFTCISICMYTNGVFGMMENTGMKENYRNWSMMKKRRRKENYGNRSPLFLFFSFYRTKQTLKVKVWENTKHRSWSLQRDLYVYCVHMLRAKLKYIYIIFHNYERKKKSNKLQSQVLLDYFAVNFFWHNFAVN
jgi:hypothetical protein